MSLLVVSYLPRGERSHTRDLLTAFLAYAPAAEVQQLELTEDVPDLFLADNLNAYVSRNYLGRNLSHEQQQSLAAMDRMTAQLQSADTLVLAFPMYNFSVPAAVKAWFDSVMQKGKTWTIGETGYQGLLTGTRALVLMSSGGTYDGERAAWDHALPLARTAFTFMGIDEIRTVTAAGMNQQPDRAPSILAEAKAEAEQIGREWFQTLPVPAEIQ